MLHKETTSDIEDIALLNLKCTKVKSLFDGTHVRENTKNTNMLYSIICAPMRFHHIVTHSKEEVYLTVTKQINCRRAQKNRIVG